MALELMRGCEDEACEDFCRYLRRLSDVHSQPLYFAFFTVRKLRRLVQKSEVLEKHFSSKYSDQGHGFYSESGVHLREEAVKM